MGPGRPHRLAEPPRALSVCLLFSRLSALVRDCLGLLGSWTSGHIGAVSPGRMVLEFICLAPGDGVYLFLAQAKIKQKLREIEENQKRIEKLEEYITTSKYVALCLPS